MGTTPDAAGPEAAGRSALVVDDDDVRRLTTLLLGRLGFQVTAAAGGAEALTVPDELVGSLDLLVTDLMMPGVSGDAVAQALIARRPGIAVVLMSGVAEELPADSRVAFLAKPFSGRRLREAIELAQRLAATPG